jgi:hypothetical protein
VRVLSGSPDSDNVTVPRSFFVTIRGGTTGFQKNTTMYLIQKNIKNADIIGASMYCIFGEPVKDCPFIQAQNLNDTKLQLAQIEILSEEEQESLRKYHRKCIKNRQSELSKQTESELTKAG